MGQVHICKLPDARTIISQWGNFDEFDEVLTEFDVKCD